MVMTPDRSARAAEAFAHAWLDWLRRPHALMLAAVFFIGLAHLAFLPPFEGMEDDAHWSSAAPMADEAGAPIGGADRPDVAVTAYPGPRPYASRPPFDANGGLTYLTFDPDAGDTPRQSRPPRPVSPAQAAQGQASQPPLYDLLLAPVRWATGGLSWTGQFFALRLVSWGFAFAGLVIGVEAARRHGVLPGAGGAVVMAAWPFLFPQFFPEMASMGHDSLGLLLTAIGFAAFLRLETRGRFGAALVLGVALGAGLWTTAFFLPITTGFAAYYVWRAWRVLREGADLAGWAAPRATGLALAAAMGGAWYVYALTGAGDLSGADGLASLGQDGGGNDGFAAWFAIQEFGRGLAALAASFAWAGTASLVRPTDIYLAGPSLLAVWVLLRWARQARTLQPEILAPGFIAAPLVAGLVVQLLVRIAAGEDGGGAPGGDLHVLAPAMGVAVAWGYRGSSLAIGLTLYTLAFTVGAWLLQLSMFSGCAAKLGADKNYSFDGASCLIDPVQLGALGYPSLGLASVLVGLALAGAAVWRLRGAA